MHLKIQHLLTLCQLSLAEGKMFQEKIICWIDFKGKFNKTF